MPKIRLAGGRGDVIARDLTVPEISVSRGRLAATLAGDGTVNWQNLMVTLDAPATASATRSPAAPPAAPAARSWRLAIDKVRVEELALAFADRSRAAPLDVDVGDITVDLSAKLENGPAGLAGYSAARGQVRPVFAYWPTLVPKEVVQPRVEVRPAQEW